MIGPVRLHGLGCAPGIYAKNPAMLAHLQGLVAQAVARQGPAALELPRSAAAIHEGGHAVVFALEGNPPVRARIKRVRVPEGYAWIGLTNRGGDAWRCGPDTDPGSDLREARIQLAGWAAEQLFEPTPRLASSLDECVVAGSMVQWAASKLGRSPEALLDEQIRIVFAALRAYERHVKAIAAALIRHTILRGAQLARLP